MCVIFLQDWSIVDEILWRFLKCKGSFLNDDVLFMTELSGEEGRSLVAVFDGEHFEEDDDVGTDNALFGYRWWWR